MSCASTSRPRSLLLLLLRVAGPVRADRQGRCASSSPSAGSSRTSARCRSCKRPSSRSLVRTPRSIATVPFSERGQGAPRNTPLSQADAQPRRCRSSCGRGGEVKDLSVLTKALMFAFIALQSSRRCHRTCALGAYNRRPGFVVSVEAKSSRAYAVEAHGLHAVYCDTKYTTSPMY